MRTVWRAPSPGVLSTLILRGNDPVACALGEWSAASGVLLLSYLAVRSDLRGHGLGGALLEEVLPRWHETLGLREQVMSWPGGVPLWPLSRVAEVPRL